MFGRETANQARERFAAAVERVATRHRSGDVVIVAHGSVIALFVAEHTPLEPFALWQRLGLPSLVVLGLPGCELLTIVEKIDDR